MREKVPKPTRKGITRERWVRGRLDYKFHEGQRDLKEKFLAKSKGQIFVNECGRQFGKTYFWVAVAIETAIRIPKARIKFGTALLTDLVEFVIPAFDAVLTDCPADLMPIYKKARSKYVFSNGAEIKLVGLDKKPNAMRGNVIDLIVIDEAGFTDQLEYLYKSVIIPATTHRPNCRIVLSSSTPKQEDHPFLEFVVKAEYEGAYVMKTVHDNPMVDQPTIDRLIYEMGGVDSDEWKREYLCQRIRDKNLTIIPEWNEKFVEAISRDDYYPFYHKYDGMDLGVRDNTAVIFGYYDFLKAKVIIEDEYVINGPELTTDVLQARIKDKEMVLWIPGYISPLNEDVQMEKKTVQMEKKTITVIENRWLDPKPNVYVRVSDNNNPLLLQDLSFLHHIHFIPTDKGKLEEMINSVRLMVNKEQIIIHPRCKQLAGCLKYGVWDKKREKFAKSKVYGHFDALAALVYLVINLDKATNPIPRGFQVDLTNQIMFPNRNESQSVQSLKRAFGIKK